MSVMNIFKTRKNVINDLVSNDPVIEPSKEDYVSSRLHLDLVLYRGNEIYIEIIKGYDDNNSNSYEYVLLSVDCPKIKKIYCENILINSIDNFSSKLLGQIKRDIDNYLDYDNNIQSVISKLNSEISKFNFEKFI